MSDYSDKERQEYYAKVKEMRNWLADHPHADFIKAYMLADKAD